MAHLFSHILLPYRGQKPRCCASFLTFIYHFLLYLFTERKPKCFQQKCQKVQVTRILIESHVRRLLSSLPNRTSVIYKLLARTFQTLELPIFLLSYYPKTIKSLHCLQWTSRQCMGNVASSCQSIDKCIAVFSKKAHAALATYHPSFLRTHEMLVLSCGDCTGPLRHLGEWAHAGAIESCGRGSLQYFAVPHAILLKLTS